MNDPYEHGLFPIAVIVVSFFIAKVLGALGIATSRNAQGLAVVLAIVVGVLYAVNFPQEKSFGPSIDIVFRVLAGAMVGVLLWFFILIGVGGALSEDLKRSPPNEVIEKIVESGSGVEMSKKSIAGHAKKRGLVEILRPLTPEKRARAVKILNAQAKLEEKRKKMH